MLFLKCLLYLILDNIGHWHNIKYIFTKLIRGLSMFEKLEIVGMDT